MQPGAFKDRLVPITLVLFVAAAASLILVCWTRSGQPGPTLRLAIAQDATAISSAALPLVQIIIDSNGQWHTHIIIAAGRDVGLATIALSGVTSTSQCTTTSIDPLEATDLGGDRWELRVHVKQRSFGGFSLMNATIDCPIAVKPYSTSYTSRLFKIRNDAELLGQIPEASRILDYVLEFDAMNEADGFHISGGSTDGVQSDDTQRLLDAANPEMFANWKDDGLGEIRDVVLVVAGGFIGLAFATGWEWLQKHLLREQPEPIAPASSAP